MNNSPYPSSHASQALSIVIPIRNEADNISPLANEIAHVMEDAAIEWECIWVDDNSEDDTLSVLREINAGEPRHRYLVLQAHEGQSAALWVGLQASRGALLATLDGDGQNDPADLPGLANVVLSGESDMAHGYRETRQDSWPRRAASFVANAWRNWLTGKTVRDVGCSTRVFRRECISLLPPFRGMHRFLPNLVLMQGFRISEHPVKHRPRQRGVSKYTIHNRLWVGLLDSFGVWWLRRRRFSARISEHDEE